VSSQRPLLGPGVTVLLDEEVTGEGPETPNPDVGCLVGLEGGEYARQNKHSNFYQIHNAALPLWNAALSDCGTVVPEERRCRTCRQL